MSLPRAGDQVRISLGNQSTLYQVQSVNSDGAYIFPMGNPNNLSLLVPSTYGWSVYGSPTNYQIEFLNSQPGPISSPRSITPMRTMVQPPSGRTMVQPPSGRTMFQSPTSVQPQTTMRTMFQSPVVDQTMRTMALPTTMRTMTQPSVVVQPPTVRTPLSRTLPSRRVVSPVGTITPVEPISTERPELTALPVTDETHTFPMTVEPKPDLDEDVPELTIAEDQVSPAWRPQLEPYTENESVYDQKILGTPLILEGYEWPTMDDMNLSFYAQFVDPNPDSPYGNDLIQIFVIDLEEVEGGGEETAVIRTIPQRDIQSKTPLDASPPSNVNERINQKLIQENNAGKIVGWTKLDTIFAGGLDEDLEDYQLDQFGSELDLNYLLQIGGVGPSFQGIDYREDDTYFNGVYNGYWGDAGAINLDREGKGFGDMG